MAKTRVSIYIDSELWDEVKREARRRSVSTDSDISANQLVVDSVRAFLSILPGREIKEPAKSGAIPKEQIKASVKKVKEARISESDDALLRKSSLFQRQGQAKLDSARAKRDVKKEKIAKVKSSGYFNPQPKGCAK